MLHPIVHGSAFDLKEAGVGETVLRAITHEQSKRAQLAGLQGGIQDGLSIEDIGGGGVNVGDEDNNWHGELIDAWETQMPSKMEIAIAKNIDALSNSQMLGMARLMLKSLVQKKIRDLSSTYLTLSFAEIAEKTKLPLDTLEGSLREMVQSKAIKARINKK